MLRRRPKMSAIAPEGISRAVVTVSLSAMSKPTCVNVRPASSIANTRKLSK